MSDIRYNSWLHRSGTGGVYQDSSGKVGIGSSVPGNALEIYGTASSVQIEVNGTGRYRGFEIHEGGTRKAYFQHDATDNCALLNTAESDLKFYTGDTQRMQLDGSGRLMIGNTVAANMYSVANNLVVGSGSGSEGITIFSDGTNDGFVVFADGQSDPAYRMGQIIYSHQQNKFHFRTNGNTDRLLIDNAGNVNISGVTTATAFIPSEGNSNKKNLLDNGEFIVDQRMGGSATAITPSGGVDYTCDRWHSSNYGGEAGRITFQTVSGDVPNSNYRQSMKLDCTTAMGAPSGNNYMSFSQFTEAKDNRFLGHGTATAKPVTLQFWIKSTKTGTASVGLARHDASREYIAEYTISSSNTWEKKTITFPGDTSGTEMAMDNGRGFKLNFVLFAGSSRHATVNQWAAFTSSYYSASANQVNLIDSTSNNIYFTGIQLEVGEVATPFEYRNYGDELLRCQRYYQKTDGGGCGVGVCNGNSNGARIQMDLKTTMRANPTVSKYGNNIYVFDGSAAVQVSTLSQTYGSTHSVEWEFNALAAGDPLTSGRPLIGYINGSAGGLQMNSEL